MGTTIYCCHVDHPETDDLSVQSHKIEPVKYRVKKEIVQISSEGESSH